MKVAAILYIPCSVGVHWKLKVPVRSVVTCPIWTSTASGPVAYSVTGTPFVVMGIGFCICRYSIHAAMSLSAIAGVPAWPADWSVTVPVMSTLSPLDMTSEEAWIVVALVPLPKQYIRLS